MSRTIGFRFAVCVGAVYAAIPLWAQQITAVWQGQQLGVVLERLAATQQDPLWLDRRVDSRQTVDVQLSNVPFAEALATVLKQCELSAAQLDDMIYVGPRETARGLATLVHRARSDVARVPIEQQRKWLHPSPASWPRLTQPRALLKELLDEADVNLVGAELVAHDLWPAREMPPLSLVDRVVLILAGFDLTCEISPDGRTCRVVVVEYPLSPGGANPHAEASSPNASPAAAKRKQFSLQLQNQPVGRVMEQLAKQLGLLLIWDEDSLQTGGRSRETLVSCQVENVELDELLHSILKPAGLSFTRESQRVEIHALP